MTTSRWETSAGLLAAFAALLLAGCGGGPQGRPESPSSGRNLFCEQAFQDLGEVDPFDPVRPVRCVFTLVNRSQAPVVVDRIRSTCGCMHPDLKERIVQPGETIELPVNLTLAPTPGRFRRSLHLDLSGPERETVDLVVAGVVKINPSLYCSPHSLDFGTVDVGDERVRDLTLARHDGSAVEFESIESPCGSVEVGPSPPRSDAARRRAASIRIAFRPTPDMVGAKDWTMTIRTGRPAPYDVVRLGARATVRPRLRFVPSIFLPNFPDGGEQCVPLMASTPDSSPPVRGVRYEGDPRVRVRLADVGDGRPAVAVRAAAGAEGAPASPIASGEIAVILDDDAEAVRIPLVLALRSPSP